MTPEPSTRLSVENVSLELAGQTVLDDVSVDVRAGELLGLVGPNGAGKSTLLSVLAGDMEPRMGKVLLDGEPISKLRAAELARRRSVLPQQNHLAFGFRVVDVVRMGRAAWANRPEEEHDDEIVADALERTDTLRFADRAFPSLSGGERARSSLARVLAQSTKIVLLDEPTAALDVRHVEVVMAQARSLACSGHAVVVVLHDLSLVAAHADRICVLADGRVRALGSAREVMTSALLSQVYDHPIDVIEHAGRLLVLPGALPTYTTTSRTGRCEELCAPGKS